jgi:hypothetical protein
MKTVLLASAAALALTAGAASAGAAHPGLTAKVTAKHMLVKAPKNTATLYDQSAGSNGIGIVSQDFTDSSFPTAYDAQGADDFTVPANTIWHVTDVYANGVYFNGSGPAPAWNVTFYKKIKGAVEKVKASCVGVAASSDNFGQVTIPCAAKLKGGTGGHTFYVSVQAQMAFLSGGEWGWNTNNNQAGKPGLWKNPGGGFGTGCSTYTALTTCIPSGEGPDFAFAIFGN